MENGWCGGRDAPLGGEGAGREGYIVAQDCNLRAVSGVSGLEVEAVAGG